MRQSLICLLLLALAACVGPAPAYLNNRIVRDRDGCAFLVAPYLNDTAFLTFNQELSADSCKFQK